MSNQKTTQELRSDVREIGKKITLLEIIRQNEWRKHTDHIHELSDEQAKLNLELMKRTTQRVYE